MLLSKIIEAISQEFTQEKILRKKRINSDKMEIDN